MKNNPFNFLRYKHLSVAEGYSDCRDFFYAMPALFQSEEGEIIYNRRNQLRRIKYGEHVFVVKSYQRPHLLNQIVYGILRSTKAKRAFDYALMLREKGIGAPEPVAYYTERFLGLFLTKSYFISLNSVLPYTYNEIIAQRFDAAEEREYLTAIAQTTATLHELGMIHTDYSRGNILFGRIAGKVEVELIDLNRLRFHAVDIIEGCQNFSERLPATERQRRIMSEVYAKERGFDAEECYRLMTKYSKETK